MNTFHISLDLIDLEIILQHFLYSFLLINTYFPAHSHSGFQFIIYQISLELCYLHRYTNGMYVRNFKYPDFIVFIHHMDKQQLLFSIFN